MNNAQQQVTDDLYQEVILDHASRPRNSVALEGALQTHEHNALCGDSLTVFVKHSKLATPQNSPQVTCIAHGCVLSMASASMMTEAVQGKSAQEIIALCDAVQRMVTGGQPVEPLQPLVSVVHYPARVKCVVMPWHALKKLILQSQAPHETR